MQQLFCLLPAPIVFNTATATVTMGKFESNSTVVMGQVLSNAAQFVQPGKQSAPIIKAMNMVGKMLHCRAVAINLVRCLAVAGCLLVMNELSAQTKTTQKEAVPTQKEMQDLMKQARQQMDSLDPETKRMMDSMGIKIPDFNKASKTVGAVTDEQLKQAWEDENRIIPQKDTRRIAFAQREVIQAGTLSAFVKKMNADIRGRYSVKEIKDCEEAYQWLSKKVAGDATSMANASAALWAMGKYKPAIYIQAKVVEQAPGDLNNLDNYAACLTMAGAPEWAIPLLDYVNKNSPGNSAVLNNLAQAWFALGDTDKANSYAGKCLLLCAWHPQANMVKSKIEQSKGHTQEAINCVRKAMQKLTSPQQIEQLDKLGYTPVANDYHVPPPASPDQLNLGSFKAPDFPKTVDDCRRNDWAAFEEQVNAELEKLQTMNQDASQSTEADMNARARQTIASMKNSMATGMPPSLSKLSPRYAKGAGLKLTETLDNYLRKVEALRQRVEGYRQGDGKQLRDGYDKKMEALRKQDDAQTGEGKPNEDFCPKYRQLTNDFLAAYNTQMESFYKEYLSITKIYLNETAHWQLYAMWPDMYTQALIADKAAWLNGMTDRFIAFEDIPKYNCDENDARKKSAFKLGKFVDPQCGASSTFRYLWGSMSSNCYETKIKVDIQWDGWSIVAGEANFNDEQVRDADGLVDFIGQSFMNGTLELGVKKSKAINEGPFKLEAEISGRLVMEFSKEGLSDVGIKAAAGISVGIADVERMPEEVNDLAGSYANVTLIGAETKVTFNSGFSFEGQGVLQVINQLK